MDNNTEVNRYLKDEYLNKIDADHQFNQREQKNLIIELRSILKLNTHRCHDSEKNRRKFWQFWQKTSLDNSIVQPQIHRIPRVFYRT